MSAREQGPRRPPPPPPGTIHGAKVGETDLSGYSVEFFRVPMFGSWSYAVTTPDNRTLRPLFGIFSVKSSAEIAALRSIELDANRSSMNGAELAAKVRRT